MRNYTILLASLLSACTALTPAKAPTSLQVATAAINVTDESLAVYIRTLPDGSDWEAWQARVDALNTAANVVRSGGGVCDMLPAVAEVATVIDCAQCTTLIRAATEQLCPTLH